jgi:hypothetical protein
MSNYNISITEWIKKFDNGEFDEPDRETQIRANWYDWFCDEDELYEKTQDLGEKLKSLLPTKLFDPDNTYVFFKNNCPCEGDLYDSFSICELSTGDVIFWIAPSCSYSRVPNKTPMVVNVKEDNNTEYIFDSWSEVVYYFHTGDLVNVTVNKWER